MKKPFVISISAQSGGGKTTIATALKNRLFNSAVLYWDDYGDEVDPSCDINDIQDYNKWNTKPIANDIEFLLNKSYDYIILDYPFGYMNEYIAKFIDMTLFIDTPLDVALARRIIRDFTSRSKESEFGLAYVNEISLEAIDKELRFYLEKSRSTYKRFSEDHKTISDHILDGLKTPDEIVNEIIKLIKDKNSFNRFV